MSRLLILTAIAGWLFAGIVANTAAFQEIVQETKSPPAEIDDVAWIAGHWRGEAMGGEFEETWNPPVNGSMMGMFKFAKDGQIGFYEILVIAPIDDSLILRLKHFHGDLKGWEEKDETVDFPLVAVSEKEVRFHGLKFQKVNDVEMHITVDVKQRDGKIQELTFVCHRVTTEDPIQFAISRVFEIDSVIAGQRDQMTNLVSLTDSIRSYIRGLDSINYDQCPKSFAEAYRKHRDAWNESIDYFEQHNQLRGEMHELFDKIRESGGTETEQLETHIQAISETWAEIKQFADKRSVEE